MYLLIFSSCCVVVFELWVLFSKRADGSQENNDRYSLLFLWVVIVLSIASAVLLRHSGRAITKGHVLIVYYAGVLCMGLGLIIRWHAIATLKMAFSVTLAVTADQKIVQSGLYKHMRHPAYLGNLISFFGLGLAFNNWLILAVIFIPIACAFVCRIFVEERLLCMAFPGVYSAYCRGRSRLIPRIY